MPLELVAEQGRGSLLFLAVRRVINFASVIQATYNFVCLHGVMDHGRIPKILLPFGAESTSGRMTLIASCLNFCWAVGECARVGGSSVPGSEAEEYGIPSMSGPRPHTEPTRCKLVGKPLHGPSVVHGNAWASSLRVVSSSANTDPIYYNTDSAYILKSHNLSTRLLVDALIFGSLDEIFRGAVQQ